VSKVLVIGDSCQDIFIYGNCPRLAPEAPAPVFHEAETTTNDGMAKNVARNLQSLNPDLEIDIITQEKEITKTRFIEKSTNHLLLRIDTDVDTLNCGDFDPHKIDFESYEMVIVSDYDKGFLSTENLRDISLKHSLVILDTKKILGRWAEHFKFIKINKEEYDRSKTASTLLFLEPQSRKWLKEALIITEGSQGCVYDHQCYPVKEIETRDFSGAGDTFLAGFACRYLEGRTVVDALHFANTCATQVVQRKGVACVKLPI
jgi:bifunctional ADP-heptose synthase (sugar kinase/adenylyltransferase)